eukprot:SM000007S20832  [mRNA]  locus=s7:403188:408933:- [translate_table: standard]
MIPSSCFGSVAAAHTGLRVDLLAAEVVTQGDLRGVAAVPTSGMAHSQGAAVESEPGGAAAIAAAVWACAAVDQHCHNLAGDGGAGPAGGVPYLRLFSEADGAALGDAVHTLSFKRSVRDLAAVYGVAPSLQALEARRRELGPEGSAALLLKEAHLAAILVDDGLALGPDPAAALPLTWHRQFVPVVKRVLRLEAVAEQVVQELKDVWKAKQQQSGSPDLLDDFEARFLTAGDDVVAFKSIAAYRSGLDINPDIDTVRSAAKRALDQDIWRGMSFKSREVAASVIKALLSTWHPAEAISKNPENVRPGRITNKDLIDYIFLTGLRVATMRSIPLQIHTGFGDKDLDLRLANPLHLRAVLEHPSFQTSRIVLLHASYPFAREAGYLASVYSQVYVDFGLAVPKLSVAGMQQTLKELQSLAPINKVMYSGDGYAYAETYYLAAKCGRGALESTLCGAMDNGDLTSTEAVEAAHDILRRNAERLYMLELPAATAPPSRVTFLNSSARNAEFEGQNCSSTRLVRLLYVDSAGIRRVRGVPIERFEKVVCQHGIGITQGCMATSSHSDAPAKNSGLTAVGEVHLEEDMVMVEMHTAPGTAWDLCPRSILRRLLATLTEEFGLSLRAGFEVEFSLLKPNPSLGTGAEGRELVPVDCLPYCSSAAFDALAPLLAKMSTTIGSMGVRVEQVHSESGHGQFECALAHEEALQAADNLLYAKEAITAVSRSSGYHSTFLPKSSVDGAASGCHVHLSLWTAGGQNAFCEENDDDVGKGVSCTGESFMAGVLAHLPALLPFTAPHPNSYLRLQPNMWAGAYQCWGFENREAPLRVAKPPGHATATNFELKAFDGCANPYLGLAAVLGAGLDGLRRGLELPEATLLNPAESPSDKVKRLPATLQEAINELRLDAALSEALGPKLVQCVLAVREAEVRHFAESDVISPKLLQIY